LVLHRTASVLIAHLDGHDPHHEAARARLLDSADEDFGASSITLTEVLVAPARSGRLAEARSALQALGVAELGLPGDAAQRLAALRAETGLKLPDCCVLLVAQDARAAVLTFDARFAREAARLSLAS
jgi:predicted nucleic acid-binding protein